MSELNNPEVTSPESIGDGIPEVTFTIEVSEVVQAPVDTTLSIAGMAADAQATGEAIEQAKSDLQAEIDSISTDISRVAGELFPVGSIYVSTSANAPTFGGTAWRWQEILMPVTNGDLMDGTRSYSELTESDTPGSIHFWLRIADAEV